MALALSGYWLNGVLWRSPEYEAQGTCTKAEIDRVYRVIDEINFFPGASVIRLNREYRAIYSQAEWYKNTNLRTINIAIYEHFQKRKTAAFFCNYTTENIKGNKSASIQNLVLRFKPFDQNENMRWHVATYMALEDLNASDQAEYDELKKDYETTMKMEFQTD